MVKSELCKEGREGQKQSGQGLDTKGQPEKGASNIFFYGIFAAFSALIRKGRKLEWILVWRKIGYGPHIQQQPLPKRWSNWLRWHKILHSDILNNEVHEQNT